MTEDDIRRGKELARAQALKDEREEVKRFQEDTREAGGERMSFHEARANLREQKSTEAKEEARLLKALERAKPGFMKDGQGVRGPQASKDEVTIDGADGANGKFQVKPSAGSGDSFGAQGGSGSILFDDGDQNGAAAQFYLEGRRA